MRTLKSARSGIRTLVWVTVAVWACILGLTGCGGEREPEPVKAEEAQGAGIGDVSESEDWTLTLVDSPYKAETVGAGTYCGPGWEPIGCLTAAEGIWVIAPVELTNRSSEFKIVSRLLFVAEDGAGNEFHLAGRQPHIHYLWESEEDRWEPVVNQVPENMLDTGASVEGPLLFDVPVGTSGLRLKLREGQGVIELGF